VCTENLICVDAGDPRRGPAQEREARFAAPDAAIARGIADVDAGRVKPLRQVFDRLEAKYREAIDTDTKRR
jgi:predicted transcriptional regulator